MVIQHYNVRSCTPSQYDTDTVAYWLKRRPSSHIGNWNHEQRFCEQRCDLVTGQSISKNIHQRLYLIAREFHLVANGKLFDLWGYLAGEISSLVRELSTYLLLCESCDQTSNRGLASLITRRIPSAKGTIGQSTRRFAKKWTLKQRPRSENWCCAGSKYTFCI